MEYKVFKYLFCVLAVCLSLSNHTRSHVVVNLLKHRMFIFGDSLFDVGNGFYTTGDNPAAHLPYGMSLNQSTGRFSDGYLVPDYIALFANMNVMPAYLKPGANFSYGANFAFFGAGVLEIRESLNLKEQLANFMTLAKSYVQQYGETVARALMHRSVFLFNPGGADYLQLITETPNSTKSQKANFVNWVMGNLSSALTDIYNVGGRRIAFQNVASLGCLPSMKELYNISHDACYEPLNEVASLHNVALLKGLATLKNKLPGFAYVVFDYYNALKDRIQNPASYGFQVGDVACCGNGTYHGSSCGTKPYELCDDPNKYVYFDGAHTGQNANYQLAQLMWNGGPNFTTPYNMKQLFGLV